MDSSEHLSEAIKRVNQLDLPDPLKEAIKSRMQEMAEDGRLEIGKEVRDHASAIVSSNFRQMINKTEELFVVGFGEAEISFYYHALAQECLKTAFTIYLFQMRLPIPLVEQQINNLLQQIIEED